MKSQPVEPPWRRAGGGRDSERASGTRPAPRRGWWCERHHPAKEPAASFSRLPDLLASDFQRLALALNPRNAWRVPLLLCGALFACGRRTVTAWFRAPGITDDFRLAYAAVYSVGRRIDTCAVSVYRRLEGLVDGDELTVILDDTPTARYGPCIDGAGIHHNPTPGPAGKRFVYGHVWVQLALVVCHPLFGPIALPLLARLYVRRKDHNRLPRGYRDDHPFRTKLELAAELLGWLAEWKGRRFRRVRVLCDGAYAKRPLLRVARQLGVVVLSRLPKNAALCSLPEPVPAEARETPQPASQEQVRTIDTRFVAAEQVKQVPSRQGAFKAGRPQKSAFKALRPVDPDAELVAYSQETGFGVLRIGEKSYAMSRIADAGRTVGMRLARPAENEREGDGPVRYDVDFTTPHGWQCDCPDSTFRPDRPGGCRHVVALRKVAAGLRCQKPEVARA